MGHLPPLGLPAVPNDDDDDLTAAKADWEYVKALSSKERGEATANVIRDLFGNEELAQKFGKLAATEEE